MTKIISLSDIDRDANTVLTVGTFDGVHEGHQTIIERVVDHAQKLGARSIVVTFDPHPREIIHTGKGGIHLLTTIEERAELLDKLCVNIMLVIPFDRDFSLLTSEQFVRDILYRKIGVREFVIGYDHHFGRDREGSRETVERLGRALDFKVEVVEAHDIGEITVSSTQVRKALEQTGHVELATKFLSRPYRLKSTVIHGDKRGKKIGYPTANLKPDKTNKVIPANGVYAVDVVIDDEVFKGMMNIGVRPTFDGSDERTLEVNLFDFDRNIYGETVEVRFIKRIRDERKFQSVKELIAQLGDDKRVAQEINK